MRQEKWTDCQICGGAGYTEDPEAVWCMGRVEKVECRSCEGRGRVDIFALTTEDEFEEQDVCPRCKTTGEEPDPEVRAENLGPHPDRCIRCGGDGVYHPAQDSEPDPPEIERDWEDPEYRAFHEAGEGEAGYVSEVDANSVTVSAGPVFGTKCDDCDGTGEVEIIGRVHDGLVTCETCDGEGRVDDDIEVHEPADKILPEARGVNAAYKIRNDTDDQLFKTVLALREMQGRAEARGNTQYAAGLVDAIKEIELTRKALRAMADIDLHHAEGHTGGVPNWCRG